MKKRILSLALAGALCLSLSAPALAAGLDNFQKVNTYTAGQFTDVPAGSWFAPNVRAAYELDLMTGSSATTFNPNGNLTVAEALVLACRLHSTYVGDGETFAANGGTWYQPYVDYAVESGIIAAGDYTDYTATATRAQFAAILAAALPDEALPAINSVTSLPDLDANAAYAGSVLKLYNAGILTGSDAAGSFKPESTIQRSEVATIVTRMADKSLRKTFTLSAAPSAPSVPASTKKFDGPITLDDLQGVWYAESYSYGALMMKSELIFDGDTLTLVRYHADNGQYDSWTGKVTVHSEMLASDPNVCHVVLEMPDSHYVSVKDVLREADDVPPPAMEYDANISLSEDCFKGGMSTFHRADSTKVYPSYQVIYNEKSADMEALRQKYVMYDEFPFIPDFGALYGLEPLPEDDDIEYSAKVQALLDMVDALTADMTVYYYSAADAQKIRGDVFPPAITPEFFNEYEDILEECGFKGEFRRGATGEMNYYFVGYGYLITYEVLHAELSYITGRENYLNDKIAIYIQPD